MEGVEWRVCQMRHDQAASTIPQRRGFPIAAAAAMQRPAERCGALMFAVVAEGAKKEGTAGEEAGAPVLLNHGQDPCSGIRRRCHYQIVPNRAIFVPRKAGRGGFFACHHSHPRRRYRIERHCVVDLSVDVMEENTSMFAIVVEGVNDEGGGCGGRQGHIH